MAKVRLRSIGLNLVNHPVVRLRENGEVVVDESILEDPSIKHLVKVGRITVEKLGKPEPEKSPEDLSKGEVPAPEPTEKGVPAKLKKGVKVTDILSEKAKEFPNQEKQLTTMEQKRSSTKIHRPFLKSLKRKISQAKNFVRF